MSRYLTEAEFAEQLGASEERVGIWRRKHGWPHLRVGRTIRYTPEHVAQIERMQTSKAKATGHASSKGQTARSVARSA